MRVLKYVILGLLNRRQSSGYDITSQFKEEIGQFWSAKHSQIYPELKKLVEEGLIQYETQIQGVRLEKKVYTITEEGKHELYQWVTALSPLPETEKDTFMLKMYFIHTMSKKEARVLFQDQFKLRQHKLQGLKSREAELQKAFGATIRFNHPDLGHYLVLSKAIAREQSYVNWLEENMKLFG